MYKQISKIVFFISFSLVSCQEKEVILTEISPDKGLKISIPQDWTTEIDSEYKSLLVEHPILKEKFRFTLEWSPDEAFLSNESEINSTIETLNKLAENPAITNMPKSISKGCEQKKSVTICRVDSSGIDVDNNNFISSDYYMASKDTSRRVVFSVRVSQKEFTKKDNELIQEILESITL